MGNFKYKKLEHTKNKCYCFTHKFHMDEVNAKGKDNFIEHIKDYSVYLIEVDGHYFHVHTDYFQHKKSKSSCSIL